jgi:NADH:ubiquinone reductase (H+-translocating)
VSWPLESRRHLPALLREGKSVPPFRLRDLGALVSLSDYNAFARLGRFGFFKGGFIKGHFAPLSPALLYRRHQLSLHGPRRRAKVVGAAAEGQDQHSIR